MSMLKRYTAMKVGTVNIGDSKSNVKEPIFFIKSSETQSLVV